MDKLDSTMTCITVVSAQKSRLHQSGGKLEGEVGMTCHEVTSAARLMVVIIMAHSTFSKVGRAGAQPTFGSLGLLWR